MRTALIAGVLVLMGAFVVWWSGAIVPGLFTFMALLCIIAFGLYIRRRRKKFEEWKEEDGEW